MQRTLVMIRHAKSSWAEPGQKDYDRPLNDRGKQDAPMMGERLKKLNVIPDLIIASSAKRTRQTAKKIAAAVGYDENSIQWEEKLYHCKPSVFDDVLYSVADDVQTLFIVAHNPGISEYVNNLSPKFSAGDMPTCGIIAARAQADHWCDFEDKERTVFLFEYPKKES